MPSVKMVACHYANRSGRGMAACFLPIDTVRELVEAGEAVWSKRATYVNFKKTEAEMPRADKSLTMGPEVIEGAAEGNLRYLCLVSAYAPIRTALAA